MSGDDQVYDVFDHQRHRFDLGDRVIISFKYAGVRCVVLPGAYGANGYVQLPRRSRRRLRNVRDIATVLCFPRRLTYVDRINGWIGFDTGMPGDYWALDDAQTYSIDEYAARSYHFDVHRQDTADGDRKPWTLDAVRVTVMQLAGLVDNYQHLSGRTARRQVWNARSQAARVEGTH